MTIAQTILAQLGDNKFIAMTGAKNFVSGDRSLTFRIGKNASKANCVRITLTASDEYRVEFLRIVKLDVVPVSHHSGIQAETLAKFIGSVFGMAVAL